MRMNLDHVASGCFLGRDVHCEFDYWPLAVIISMPPTKVCPQCKAAVPVRRKTCEHCDQSKQKAECGKLVIDSSQHTSTKLLRRGFGTSVPFIVYCSWSHGAKNLIATGYC